MKGAGYYDRHSGAQLSAIQARQGGVDDAVANLLLPVPAQPVTVLDLGSSEGRNAVRLMAAVVAGLRRRTGQPLRTIDSDLAGNNFNQLFANLQEDRASGPRSPNSPGDVDVAIRGQNVRPRDCSTRASPGDVGDHSLKVWCS
jgi:hypothetical protein